METFFFALLALCAGNSPVTDEFPAQRPVTPSFDVFFDLRLNNYDAIVRFWFNEVCSYKHHIHIDKESALILVMAWRHRCKTITKTNVTKFYDAIWRY